MKLQEVRLPGDASDPKRQQVEHLINNALSVGPLPLDEQKYNAVKTFAGLKEERKPQAAEPASFSPHAAEGWKNDPQLTNEDWAFDEEQTTPAATHAGET